MRRLGVFWAALAFALSLSALVGATQTIYVNTDNASTEDGTTVGTGWSTLAEALADVPTTMTEDVIIECSGATADATAATTSGINTNGFTLTIRGNRSEADGFYDGEFELSTSHYRLAPSSGSIMLTVASNNVVVDGIQVVTNTSGGGRGIQLILPTGSTQSATVRNSRVRATGTDQTAIELNINTADGSTHYVQNNILTVASGATSLGISALWTAFRVSDAWITGNTIFGCITGILLDDDGGNTGADAAVHNNAVANCTTDYSDITASVSVTATHNASDDGFGTSAQDLSPGTPESSEWPDHWTDPTASDGSKDFRPVDSGALDDNGTTGTGILTTDILGNARDGSTPDIGAFEEVGGGGGGLAIPVTVDSARRRR